MNKSRCVLLLIGVALLTATVLTGGYQMWRYTARETPPEPLIPPVPSKQSLTLVFTGDLMQHLPQVQAATLHDGKIDYTSSFSLLHDYFQGADFVITNLETTLGNPPYSGYPQFRSPVQLAQAMQQAGIDIAALANNHICDRGAAGLHATLQALSTARLRTIGAFDPTTGTEAPLWLEKNGFRIALFNYTYGTNGLPIPQGYCVSKIDTLRMAHSIQSARQAGASQIICLFHWGNEYEQRPNTQQRALAALCHRLGVEMVIGSHPHVVQSVETVCDTTGRITHLTAFSMGNFLSNQRFPGTDGGITLRITLTQEGESAPCFQPEYLIHWTAILPDSSRRSGRCYRVIPSYERDLLPAPQKEAFDRFLQRTRRYMSRYSHGFAEITTRPTATPASCNSAASSAVRP